METDVTLICWACGKKIGVKTLAPPAFGFEVAGWAADVGWVPAMDHERHRIMVFCTERCRRTQITKKGTYRKSCKPVIPQSPDAIQSVVVIAIRDGRVLLLHRTTEDTEYYGWCFPGGKVRVGRETKVEAALREFKEETGITATNNTGEFIRNMRSFNHSGKEYCISAVVVNVPEDAQVTLSHEHMDWHWYTPEEGLAQPVLAGEVTKYLLEFLRGGLKGLEEPSVP